MFKQSTSYLLILSLGLTPGAIFNTEVLATPLFPTYLTQYSGAYLPEGTEIPLESQNGEKILLLPGESMAITLIVAKNVTNERGKVLVPAGSEISGRLEPKNDGVRFVAQSLNLPNGERYTINGTSRVINRRETIEEGANNQRILQGAVVGASAAALLAGITGDNKIRAGEVLGGAGLGALLGFAFRSKNAQELISINPNQDLDITLRSELNFKKNWQ